MQLGDSLLPDLPSFDFVQCSRAIYERGRTFIGRSRTFLGHNRTFVNAVVPYLGWRRALPQCSRALP